MRLRLTIRPLQKSCSIPINYNYFLSSAIYRWIEASSPEYSAFLHEHGFQPDGVARRFKHFCFSQLIVPERSVHGNRLQIRSSLIHWCVGMPVEETLQHFVMGLFERQQFYIGSHDTRFAIEHVEVLPEPTWSRSMRFRMLSPLTVSVPEERNGSLIPHYLFADDPRLPAALRSNIINKYRSLHNGAPAGAAIDHAEFYVCLETDFIRRQGGAERVSKLITIREGQSDQTRVRGFLCPLTIEGEPELIRLAYESGLGEKNSMGFGMIEVVT